MAAHKNHPYHLVNPSPWPFIGALSALALTSGGVLYMHGHTCALLLAGVGLFLLTIIGWWRDVIQEAKTEHNPVIRRGFQYGMILFIFSEVMFFVSFFWAYFDAALSPKEVLGYVWPPKNIHTLDPFDLPYLNTLVLLLSGTTVTWAHYAMVEGNMKDAMQKIGYTVLLGLIFLSIQAYEYAHAPFTFKQGIYPSTFYMATGFHGFHVLIGTIFLIVCFFRTRAGHFKADDHFGFEAAAWYWHFVDVVWLFLFLSIYWWGSNS
jgi:heme/copper-type cytochrome/quinol oxidase subunit 3